MRIVIAAGIYPPDIGGPATYAEHMANFLSQEGHEVEVICYGDQPGIERRGKTVVRTINRGQSKILGYFRYWLILSRLALHNDVVYAQGPLLGGIQSLIVTKLFFKPYVIKVTGDYAWEQASVQRAYQGSIDDFQRDSRVQPFKILLMRYLQKLVCRQASMVIVPSEYLKRLVLSWGVSERRVTVIYNAVTPMNMSSVDAPALSIDGEFIISVGRLVPWKGFETLISLWPEVTKEFPDVRLLIIGDGYLQSALQRSIEKYGARNVVLVGRVSRGQLATYFSRALALILNSSYEGLSHVVLEARHYKLPCLISDAGGNLEVVRDGHNGLLFPHDDREKMLQAIRKVLSSSKLRHELGNYPDDWSRFSLETMSRRTLETLRSAVT